MAWATAPPPDRSSAACPQAPARMSWHAACGWRCGASAWGRRSRACATQTCRRVGGGRAGAGLGRCVDGGADGACWPAGSYGQAPRPALPPPIPAPAQAACPAAATSKKGGDPGFALGSVGRCLGAAVAEGRNLTAPCRALVLAAAPRDARSIVAGASGSVEAVAARVAEVRGSASSAVCLHIRPMSAAGIWVLLPGAGGRVAPPACHPCQPRSSARRRHPHTRPPAHPRCHQIAKKAGLGGALVSQRGSGLAAITITGWVAFVSVGALALVAAGLAGFGLWRAFGARRAAFRYTPVSEVKEGDV